MAEDKRKHILLISVGMSPAVITETVYALNQVNDAPQEVVAITTVKGKEAVMEQLFGEDAVWETMLKECNLKGKVIFGEANIELIPDENKNYSKDIVSDSDNNELADKLLKILRGYTTPDYRISFSIAGGRKSMSAVGALVMSLLGRKEDKMYHILVPKPFDDFRLEPRFYYPRDIEHKLGEEVHSGKDAELRLSKIPFVRSRYWFYDKGMDTKSYSTMVDEINRQKELRIVLDTSTHKVFVRRKKVGNISFLGFCLYWMLIERYLKNMKKEVEKKDLPSVFETFLKDKNIEIIHDANKDERKGKLLKNIASYSINSEDLSSELSDVNSSLTKEDGSLGINPERTKWRVSSLVDRNLIEIKNNNGEE